MKNKMVKVPDIHRRGYIFLDKDVLCSKCKGEKTQIYSIYKYDDDGFPISEPSLEPCDMCEGTGKIYFRDLK